VAFLFLRQARIQATNSTLVPENPTFISGAEAVNLACTMRTSIASTLPTAEAVSAATAKQRMLKLLVCSDAPEQALRYRGFRMIAGVDEVGRGALFGPVVAAAVILPERCRALARAGLKDSKQLDRKQRERLDRRIRKRALAISIAEVDAETIDRINIYQASRMAMLAAVQGLSLSPDHLLIDALRIDHSPPHRSLPRSTATVSCVSWTPSTPDTVSPRTRATRLRRTASCCASSARARSTGGALPLCGH